MRRVRIPVLIMVLSIVMTACGARLTDEQRAFVIDGGVVGGTTGDASTTDGSALPETTGDATTGGSTTGTTTTGTTTPATTGGATTGAPQGTAGTTTGGTTGTASSSTGAATATTGAATTGGTTGAPAACGTSVAAGADGAGITDDKIVIANVADISGAVPGLFKDAQQAVQAYALMINSGGGICGRTLEVLGLDARLDTNGNRNAYQTACADSFAAVGSMSAFEQGAATVIRDCNFPDLRTAAPSKPMQQVETVFSTDAMSPGWQPLSEYNYWATQSNAKKAAFLYIAAETTNYQVNELVVPGAEAGAGYDFVYVQEIDIAETNYAPFVLEMKDREVDFVSFQGAFQQAGKLAQAMQQQEFKPGVFALQSNAYTPALITQYGDALVATNTQIAVPSVILEEIDQHPEMQLYAQWLARIDPQAKPTGLGIYAWASARLFVETVTTMPELSRSGFIAKLKTVKDYDGNKLIPPQRIGEKIPADCVIIVRPTPNGFVRHEPAGSGLRCDNEVQQVPIL